MRNKCLENFIYLESVNLLSFNSSFIKMDTKTKFLWFWSVKQFLQEKKKNQTNEILPVVVKLSHTKNRASEDRNQSTFTQFIFKLYYWEI